MFIKLAHLAHTFSEIVHFFSTMVQISLSLSLGNAILMESTYTKNMNYLQNGMELPFHNHNVLSWPTFFLHL